MSASKCFDADPDRYAFVDCLGHGIEDEPTCGTVALTLEQYEAQMDDPDGCWLCPTCGAPADFNDALSEAAMGVTGTEDDDEDESDDLGEFDVDEDQEWLDFDEDC